MKKLLAFFKRLFSFKKKKEIVETVNEKPILVPFVQITEDIDPNIEVELTVTETEEEIIVMPIESSFDTIKEPEPEPDIVVNEEVPEQSIIEEHIETAIEPILEAVEALEESKPNIFKRLSNKLDSKVSTIKETFVKPKQEKLIGDLVFQKYERGMELGQFGVVAFVDGVNGKLELGRTSKLNDYLSGISSSTISAGRYGRGLQDMKKIEVYFYEVNDKESVLKIYSNLNKMIFKK